MVAAICLSPVVLARAGLLKGREATVFPTPEALEELENGGAIYVKQGVVVSGRVITANGPQSAQDFALAICQALTEGR